MSRATTLASYYALQCTRRLSAGPTTTPTITPTPTTSSTTNNHNHQSLGRHQTPKSQMLTWWWSHKRTRRKERELTTPLAGVCLALLAAASLGVASISARETLSVQELGGGGGDYGYGSGSGGGSVAGAGERALDLSVSSRLLEYSRNDESRSPNRLEPLEQTSRQTPDGAQFSGPLLALLALLVLINLIVILGNILVILAVYASAKLRNVTNIFIVSLATADLMLGIFVLPYAMLLEVLGDWIFGRIWCRGWLVTDVWISTASILNLCAISVDRYVAVTRPVKYRSIMTPKRARQIVAGVWIVSFLICFPPLLPNWTTAMPGQQPAGGRGLVGVPGERASTSRPELQVGVASVGHAETIRFGRAGAGGGGGGGGGRPTNAIVGGARVASAEEPAVDSFRASNPVSVGELIGGGGDHRKPQQVFGLGQVAEAEAAATAQVAALPLAGAGRWPPEVGARHTRSSRRRQAERRRRPAAAIKAELGRTMGATASQTRATRDTKLTGSGAITTATATEPRSPPLGAAFGRLWQQQRRAPRRAPMDIDTSNRELGDEQRRVLVSIGLLYCGVSELSSSRSSKVKRRHHLQANAKRHLAAITIIAPNKRRPNSSGRRRRSRRQSWHEVECWQAGATPTPSTPPPGTPSAGLGPPAAANVSGATSLGIGGQHKPKYQDYDDGCGASLGALAGAGCRRGAFEGSGELTGELTGDARPLVVSGKLDLARPRDRSANKQNDREHRRAASRKLSSGIKTSAELEERNERKSNELPLTASNGQPTSSSRVKSLRKNSGPTSGPTSDRDLEVLVAAATKIDARAKPRKTNARGRNYDFNYDYDDNHRHYCCCCYYYFDHDAPKQQHEVVENNTIEFGLIFIAELNGTGARPLDCYLALPTSNLLMGLYFDGSDLGLPLPSSSALKLKVYSPRDVQSDFGPIVGLDSAAALAGVRDWPEAIAAQSSTLVSPTPRKLIGLNRSGRANLMATICEPLAAGGMIIVGRECGNKTSAGPTANSASLKWPALALAANGREKSSTHWRQRRRQRQPKLYGRIHQTSGSLVNGASAAAMGSPLKQEAGARGSIKPNRDIDYQAAARTRARTASRRQLAPAEATASARQLPLAQSGSGPTQTRALSQATIAELVNVRRFVVLLGTMARVGVVRNNNNGSANSSLDDTGQRTHPLAAPRGRAYGSTQLDVGADKSWLVAPTDRNSRRARQVNHEHWRGSPRVPLGSGEVRSFAQGRGAKIRIETSAAATSAAATSAELPLPSAAPDQWPTSARRRRRLASGGDIVVGGGERVEPRLALRSRRGAAELWPRAGKIARQIDARTLADDDDDYSVELDKNSIPATTSAANSDDIEPRTSTLVGSAEAGSRATRLTNGAQPTATPAPNTTTTTTTTPTTTTKSSAPNSNGSRRAEMASAANTERHESRQCTLFHDKTYVVYSALGSFYIPMFIMIFFYSRIYLVASRAQKALQRGYMTTKWPVAGAHSRANAAKSACSTSPARPSDWSAGRGGGGAADPDTRRSSGASYGADSARGWPRAGAAHSSGAPGDSGGWSNLRSAERVTLRIHRREKGSASSTTAEAADHHQSERNTGATNCSSTSSAGATSSNYGRSFRASVASLSGAGRKSQSMRRGRAAPTTDWLRNNSVHNRRGHQGDGQALIRLSTLERERRAPTFAGQQSGTRGADSSSSAAAPAAEISGRALAGDDQDAREASNLSVDSRLAIIELDESCKISSSADEVFKNDDNDNDYDQDNYDQRESAPKVNADLPTEAQVSVQQPVGQSEGEGQRKLVVLSDQEVGEQRKLCGRRHRHHHEHHCHHQRRHHHHHHHHHHRHHHKHHHHKHHRRNSQGDERTGERTSWRHHNRPLRSSKPIAATSDEQAEVECNWVRDAADSVKITVSHYDEQSAASPEARTGDTLAGAGSGATGNVTVRVLAHDHEAGADKQTPAKASLSACSDTTQLLEASTGSGCSSVFGGGSSSGAATSGASEAVRAASNSASLLGAAAAAAATAAPTRSERSQSVDVARAGRGCADPAEVAPDPLAERRALLSGLTLSENAVAKVGAQTEPATGRADRSLSYALAPVARAPAADSEVSWRPESGRAETQFATKWAARLWTSGRRSSSRSPDERAATTAAPSSRQVHSSSSNAMNASQASGLSLMVNSLPQAASQVRKHSMMLLSTITSRGSQTLRRLSMVAAHPVGSFLSRSRTGTNSSVSSASDEDSSSAGGSDESDDSGPEVTGDELSVEAAAAAAAATGATGDDLAARRVGRKLKSSKSKAKKSRRRSKGRQRKSRGTSGGSPSAPKRTLDDYLMAVAGIDGSSSDDQILSDYDDEDDDDDYDDEDDDDDDDNGGADRRGAGNRNKSVNYSLLLAGRIGESLLIPNIRVVDHDSGAIAASQATTTTTDKLSPEPSGAPIGEAMEVARASGDSDMELSATPDRHSTNGERDSANRARPSQSSLGGLQRQGGYYERATSRNSSIMTEIPQAPIGVEVETSKLLVNEVGGAKLNSSASDSPRTPTMVSATGSGTAKTSTMLSRLANGAIVRNFTTKKPQLTADQMLLSPVDQNQQQQQQQLLKFQVQPRGQQHQHHQAAKPKRRVAKRTTRWHAKRLRAETKAAKTVAIIVGGFIFCWLPFFTAYLSRAIICAQPDCIPQTFMSLFIWLGYMNSAINPVIYGLFSADFRVAFKNILCRCRFRNGDDTKVVSVLVDSIIKSIL